MNKSNALNRLLAFAGALMLLSGCSAKKVDVPDTAETEGTTTSVSTDSTEAAPADTTAEAASETAAETQAAPSAEGTPEETTTAVPDETKVYDLEGSGFVNFSMPEITIDMPEISLPDMSVPSIEDYFGTEFGTTATTEAETEVPEAASETSLEHTVGESVETVISDNSPNGFVFEGKAMEVGDERNGYIMVPDDFYIFKDSSTKIMLQYSDATGKNVITVNRIPDQNAYDCTQLIMAALDEQGVLTGLTGAKVKLGDYDAYQVYGSYPDGIFFVCWVTEDKDDPGNCYYVSFELDSVHQNAFALSSTYKMPQDHK